MKKHNETSAPRSFLRRVKVSPLWFITPAAVLLAGMGYAMAGYEPLVFDASLYQIDQASAAEMADLDAEIDAEELEEEKAAKDAKSETVSVDSLAKNVIGADTQLADGSYIGYARCAEEDIFDYYLKLTITVKDGKVTGITKVGGSSTGNSGSKKLGAYETVNDPYIQWAAQGRTVGGKTFAGVVSQIMSQVKAGKAVSNIDTVSGATYTSRSILTAYYDALGKSAKAGGAKVKAPKTVTEPQSDEESSADDDVVIPPDSTTTDDDAIDTTDYGSGIFTSYALCQDEKDLGAYGPYYIGVTITTFEGKVVSITDIFGDSKGVVDPSYIYSAAENKYYLDRAIKGYGISGKHPGIKTQIETLLAAGKTDGTIDTISGATYSSRSIIEAYRLSLQAAAASVQTASQETDSAVDPQETNADEASEN